jgi:hypothetical protein
MPPKKVGGNDKPESPFKKRMREKVENEIKAKQLAEVEKKREAGIITTYLDKLEKQMRDKKLSSFYVLVDNVGFKKYNVGSSTIQKIVDENPKKYIGKKIALFGIFYYQHNKIDSFESFKDVWLKVTLKIFCPNGNGKINNDDYKAHGVNFYWRTEDFKKTRFTFKFLEMIMHAFTDKYSDLTISLTGLTLERLFHHLDERKVAYKHLLNPLAGL